VRKGKLFLTCVAFCLTVFVFSLITGWPSSLSHVALLATVGWLISVGLLDPELKTKSIPAVAALCALVLLSGFLVWQKPWEEKGKVWVNYDAAFFYLGENSPVDNVSLELPLPVKGENLLFTSVHWGLCWQNIYGKIFRQMAGDENSLTQWWGFRGSRGENLTILDWGRGDSKVRFTVDRLYPNEAFLISWSGYVWKKELGRVTARAGGENPKGSFSSPRPIRVRFWVELTKIVGGRPELVEAFLSDGEGSQGSLELLPTENTFWQLFVRF
jgi:hypothetical protein